MIEYIIYLAKICAILFVATSAVISLINVKMETLKFIWLDLFSMGSDSELTLAGKISLFIPTAIFLVPLLVLFWFCNLLIKPPTRKV